MKPWVGSGCWVLLLVCSVAAACGTTSPSPKPPSDNAGGEPAGGAPSAASGERASAGESGASPLQPSEPLPLEDAWLPMLQAHCEREERCGGAAYYRHVPGGCVAALSRDWQEAFAGLAALIEKGTARYDAVLAPACVEARRNARCDSTRFPPACEAAIDGLLEPGDACDEAVECAGSASCAGCPRQCVLYPAEGEACEDRCDVGLRCTAGRCVARLLEGDSCGSLEEPLSCGPSLYCAHDVEGEPGVCRLSHAAKLGEPCGERGAWWCEGDAACVVTQIVDEAPQQECVAPSESGGECWRGNGDTCPPGEYCPTPAPGERSARCVPLAKQGERCPESRECEHGTSCLFGNTCVKLGELGDACVVDADCYYGLCAEGECVSTRSCDAPMDETQLWHSPPRPKETCPSEAPGALLEGWDSAEAALGWVERLDEAAGTAAWIETERFSCSGALHLRASLSESAPEAFLVRDIVDSAEPDWSGYSKVHTWVRLAEPGVGNVEGLVNVVTSVLVPTGEQSASVHQERVDASWLRDWQWHELVLDLPLDGRESVSTFRVSLELAAPEGVAEPIELDLYVDDIWLEWAQRLNLAVETADKPIHEPLFARATAKSATDDSATTFIRDVVAKWEIVDAPDASAFAAVVPLACGSDDAALQGTLTYIASAVGIRERRAAPAVVDEWLLNLDVNWPLERDANHSRLLAPHSEAQRWERINDSSEDLQLLAEELRWASSSGDHRPTVGRRSGDQMRALIAPRPPRPTPGYNRRVSLISVEDGASMFNSYLSLDECEETVVARQGDGELPAEFSRRVIGRIAAIERSAQCIGHAVIAVGPGVDDQWMAARHLVVRALLTHAHVSGVEAGELVLAVDSDAKLHLRHGLMALVETLIGEAESSRMAIRVRFGIDAESGTYRI